MFRWIPAFAGALSMMGCAATNTVPPDTGHAYTPDVMAPPPPPPPAPPPASPPKQYQWLHGSAEAAVLSRQAYDAMARYVIDAADRRTKRRPIESAVLAAGSSPVAPRWEACGNKPSAVVLDMDETAILNTGANYDAAVRGDPPFDPARWAKYEETGATMVEAVPGASDVLAELRRRGVMIIFNSNRENKFAQAAADALKTAGLGDAKPLDTLWLRGDVAPGSGKDPRRAAIAARYCVLAMAGDQLGDFSDAFNDRALSVQSRRALGQTPALRGKWGAGWFLIPNPLYGPGVAGTFDDLFPINKRWMPEEAK